MSERGLGKSRERNPDRSSLQRNPDRAISRAAARKLLQRRSPPRDAYVCPGCLQECGAGAMLRDHLLAHARVGAGEARAASLADGQLGGRLVLGRLHLLRLRFDELHLVGPGERRDGYDYQPARTYHYGVAAAKKIWVDFNLSRTTTLNCSP